MLSLERQVVSVYPKGWGTNGEVGRPENTEGHGLPAGTARGLQDSAKNTEATRAWTVLKGPRWAEQYTLSPHPQIHIEQNLSMWPYLAIIFADVISTVRPHCRRLGPASNDPCPCGKAETHTRGSQGTMEAEVG